jgi:bifunctional non-homologous end joining protein LigD
VTLTHPSKVLFPADGITKQDLADYYALVADAMLPHLRRRPITMERYPAGIGAKGFLQKNVVKGFPAWLKRVEAPKAGGTVNYPLANDKRSLEWMANQNTITLHVWASRVPHIQRPDLCIVDLDPSEDDPPALREAMLGLKAILEDRGVTSYVKTSGSKGFHVVVPQKRATFHDTGEFSGEVATALVDRLPRLTTLAFAKAEREGKIFVDVGRNRPGATFAAAYTVRAKPGAPVSAPCTWQEVADGTVHPQTFTLRTMAARLAAVGDLWAPLAPRRAAGRPRS